MKNLFAALAILASTTAVQAAPQSDDATQRLIGTCIAVQAARLDDGSQSLDIISKAVAAGCMSTLRTALVSNNDARLSDLTMLSGSVADDFGVENVLEDMAANAVIWLRGPGHSHQVALSNR